jgi:Putative auto-transporter adhesin, head GIN domain
MNKWIVAALTAATLSAACGPAVADEKIAERRGVDARVVRVRLGGVIDLHLAQGPTASLVLYGDKRQLAMVSTVQQGDTLQIDTGKHDQHFSSGKRQLRAELTLPNLNEFVSHGVGTSEVTGFAGDEVKLALDGAGAVTVTSGYRKIDARLGGVGSMTLNSGETERVELNMRGAGQITINGQSKLLRAKLGGVGSLDARALHADTVDLDMSGLGGATVYARTAANLKLNGLGSAKVYGKPAKRNATARGLGSVSWE